MATTGGNPGTPLIEDLFEHAYAWEFVQAVRVLEWIAPEREPVGCGVSFLDEAVRFRSSLSLAFPGTDLVEADPGDGGPADRSPPLLEVAFMGLAGALGPLPRPFTELLWERRAAHDYAAIDFLDILNHRLVSLFYRSRVRSRPELESLSPERSTLGRLLLRFAGRDPDRERRWGKEASWAMPYAGALWRPRRGAAGLEGILRHRLGVPVEVRQLVGMWRELEPSERTWLGPQGRNRRLGHDAVLGTRWWDQGAGVAVVLGPLSRREASRFLGTGRAPAEIRRIAGEYLPGNMSAHLRVRIRPDTPHALGSRTLRLGWTSWTARTREEYEVWVPLAEIRRAA